MPIEVTWGNAEQTLIVMTFDGDWDWYAFYHAAGLVTRMMVTVPHPVDIILDLTRSRHNPPDFPVHAARPSFHRRNVGVVVAIQRDEFSLASQIPRFVPQRSRIYGSVIYTHSHTEAQAVLKRRSA